MPSTYDIGDRVTITGKFSTAASSTAWLDPSIVNFALETPSGTVSTFTVSPPTTSSDLIRESTGEFIHRHTTTEAGSYEYRWTVAGGIDAAEEGSFLVRTRRVNT